MLLEIAIGDAYGAGFEFAEEEIIKKEHKLDKYYGSRIDDLKAGQYTDDTQMTLALIELLLSEKEWNKENIADSFLNVFHRDQRPGYAKGFYNFLLNTKTAEDFNNKIINNSLRNGAAMRAVPLGVFNSIEEVKEISKIQASVTHNTCEGIISSQAVSLMSYYFINNIGDVKGLKPFIEEELQYSFIENKTTRTKCDGIDTINAVLTVLNNSNTLKEILDHSVSLGGDTDSVASIALGVASFSTEYEKDLPDFLFEDLENNEYGKDYMKKLESNFFSKYKIS